MKRRILMAIFSVLVATGCGSSRPAAPRGPATMLVFTAVPGSIVTGVPFSVEVQAQRVGGSIDTDFTGTITVALATGPGALDGTTSRPAVAGVATSNDLVVSTSGSYTLNAASDALASAVSSSISASDSPPEVIRTGAFNGQNGYVTAGSLQILRDASGTETFRTGGDFRVSSGGGSISIWLTDATGASNLNASSQKTRLGGIIAGFSGEYSFQIPATGSSSYTHAVAYCDGARVNFGNAALMTP